MTVAYGARGSAGVPGSDVWRITGTGTQCRSSIRRYVRDKDPMFHAVLGNQPGNCYAESFGIRAVQYVRDKGISSVPGGKRISGKRDHSPWNAGAERH